MIGDIQKAGFDLAGELSGRSPFRLYWRGAEVELRIGTATEETGFDSDQGTATATFLLSDVDSPPTVNDDVKIGRTRATARAWRVESLSYNPETDGVARLRLARRIG